MKTFYEKACILSHIGSCCAMIGPTLISVDHDCLENKLSEPDILEIEIGIDKAESERLSRIQEVAAAAAIDPDIKEDSKLRVPELIKKYKYEVEVHEVITSDGYILQMHRIPGGPKSPPRKGKTPVFLMHGVFDSSAAWVVMRPNYGLAYLLADQGYDVWMGNARGNTYSRRHIKFNPDGWRWQRKKFWSFSWHEIGIFDLPALIDYVLESTEHSKLHYVGHSQGSTAFFVMCSERPEYNDKIIMMNALAPVAYAKHIKSLVVRAFTPFLYTLDKLASLVGIYELLPSCQLFILGGIEACKDKAVTQEVCENILFLIAGYSSDQMNATMLPVVLGHTPAGSSAHQLIHYGQEYKSGHFRQYDHGWIQNYIKYNQLAPPDYILQNVKSKVSVFYSAADALATMEDVQRLVSELPNVVSTILVEHDSFNHIDFVWAIHAPRLVYAPLINLMKQMDAESEQIKRMEEQNELD